MFSSSSRESSKRVEYSPWRHPRSCCGHYDRSLVLDAGGIGARRAELVAVEVRQVVVVALDALDQLAMPETATTSGADARLGADDAGGQHVIAGVAELP